MTKNKFTRKKINRRYKKIFYYLLWRKKKIIFNTLENSSGLFRLNSFLPNIQPRMICQKAMIRYLKDNKSDYNRKIDEFWFVVDKDQWTEKDKNRRLAVSCPSFEYWLFLHFEDEKQIVN